MAKKLHYSYVDSGAMYRAITLYAMNAEIAKDGAVDEDLLITSLDHIDVDFVNKNGLNTVRLNGMEVEGEIRSMQVSSLVSQVSKIAAVRKKLRIMQQHFAGKGGVVMDGRDIGSAVLPNAELKIFMTADKTIRAKRRYDELLAKGTKITIEEVAENIEERDRIDTTRKENPLIRVKEARLLDNSNLSESEQLQIALKWSEEFMTA